MSSNYIARCDPRKIIPIYPCRYVVADELLLTDSKQLPAALTPPAGVDQALTINWHPCVKGMCISMAT